MDTGITIALIMSAGTMAGLIYTQYMSRQRQVSRIDIINKQSAKIAELNDRLDAEISRRRISDTRIEALEQINRDVIIELEKFLKGTKILINQLQENEITPAWKPVSMNFRGDNSYWDESTWADIWPKDDE